MDDLKEQFKKTEAEVERVKHQLVVTGKQFQAALKQAQAVQDYVEAEHTRISAEPASDLKAERLQFAELRLQSSMATVEIAQLAASLDYLKPIPPATKKRFDELCLYVQYIGFEMNLARYQPVRQALGIALGLLAAPEAARPADSPVRAPQPARPGLSRPPVPGTSATGARPGARLGARPPLPPPLPRPATPPGRGLPQRANTGSLREGPPLPPTRPGTRPLGKPSGVDPLALAEELKGYLTVEEVRQKLRVLYDRIEEVEAAMAPLRGPTTGELSVPFDQASSALRQLAGKVYFIHRAIAALDEHGDLPTVLAFQNTEVDPNVQQIMMAISVEGGAEPAAPGAEGDSGPTGSRFRSPFKA